MIPILLTLLILWLIAYLLTGWLHRRGWPAWHKDLLAAGLLALACIGYFWRILFGDAYMPADGGDLISFLLPTYRFAAESLRAGQWPLWNPHLYGGAPHVADIQAGFLYPVNLAIFLLAPGFDVKAMESLSILHFWWAGLGMFVFLRSLGWRSAGQEKGSPTRIGRPAALLAGIAFAFSDPFWTHFGNLNLIAVASWLPWVMACVARGLEGGGEGVRRVRWGLGWAAAGGVLLGIGSLAGHVQATIFIGLAVVIYGLFWLYGELQDRERPAAGVGAGADRSDRGGRTQGREARRSGEARDTRASAFYAVARLIAHLVAVALVAFLVAAPVLLPALELTRYSARADWTYQQTVGFSLSPAQWIGLLIPGFFGRGPQLHWGLWPRVEVGYLGILPLALAALALLARRDRRTWTLAGLGTVAFVLALGIYSVPHGWLSLLPGFNLLRAPARFVLLMDFGLAALAAIGLQVLIEPLSEGENWRAIGRLATGLGWAARVVLALVVPLTFAALLLAQDKDPGVYLRVGVAAIAILLFVAFLLASLGLVAARKAGWAQPRTLAVLALLLVYLDLASTGAYNDISSEDPARGFQHPEIAAFLAQEEAPVRIDARTGIDQLWQPDTALVYGLDDVWGIVNPSILAHYERYWEGMGSRSSRLYDFLNTAYVIGRKDVALDWSKFELAFEGDSQLNVYRNRAALPRAQLIHQAAVVQSEEAAWQAIHAPDFDLGRQVVIQTEGSELPPAQPASGQEHVDWLWRRVNDLALEVTTTTPGYLVLSEVWYPGWQAEVDLAGEVEPQPVLRANYAFRAVPLWQAGTYRVVLRFSPPAWPIGLLLSGLTLLLLLAAWAWSLRGRQG